MQEPNWIRDDVVFAVHRRQLAEHGGGDGTRDAGLLASALARPRNLWAYGDPPSDFAALAASYAYGPARNHPFVDGNNRTAFVVCRTFLKLNGYNVQATQEEKYSTFLALAAGEMPEEELASWLRNRLLPEATE